MFEDYYGTPDLGLLEYLLAGGQGLPTPQPVVPEPVPAQQSLPAQQPVVAVPADQPPTYSLPTPQPVEAQAVNDGVDWAQAARGLESSNFSLSNLGSVLSDPGPAYDPNMVYRFDTGSKIGVPNASGGWDYQNAAPVVFQPGQQYVLTDRSGRNVIARANTPEEMQRLVDLSSSEGNWSLYRADESGNIVPGTQLFSKNENLNLGSVLLPMAAVAGAAFGLNALGLGAGAGGAAGAAGTGAAGTGAAAMPSVGAALADVGAQLAGTSVFGLPAAATTAGTLAAAAPAFGGITVVGAPAAGVSALAPAALGAGTLGAALAAAQPGPINYGDQVYNNTAPEPDYSNVNEIVVESPSITPPAPTPPLSLGDIATLAPLVPPITSIPNVDVPMQELPAEPPAPEPDIVVTAPKQPPLTIDQIMTLPAATTLAPNTSTITEPSTVQPEPQQDTLLRDIMRYYSLGSGLLDALGVGKGGSAAPTTPYTSTLGVLPTFGRGAFTPYQGDYEQYGFGPEFNFFGSQPTTGA